MGRPVVSLAERVAVVGVFAVAASSHLLSGRNIPALKQTVIRNKDRWVKRTVSHIFKFREGAFIMTLYNVTWRCMASTTSINARIREASMVLRPGVVVIVRSSEIPAEDSIAVTTEGSHKARPKPDTKKSARLDSAAELRRERETATELSRKPARNTGAHIVSLKRPLLTDTKTPVTVSIPLTRWREEGGVKRVIVNKQRPRTQCARKHVYDAVEQEEHTDQGSRAFVAVIRRLRGNVDAAQHSAHYARFVHIPLKQVGNRNVSALQRGKDAQQSHRQPTLVEVYPPAQHSETVKHKGQTAGCVQERQDQVVVGHDPRDDGGDGQESFFVRQIERVQSRRSVVHKEPAPVKQAGRGLLSDYVVVLQASRPTHCVEQMPSEEAHVHFSVFPGIGVAFGVRR
uniref:Uncharacterized protein n=1 Tax=Mycena chlorophos TaxID=658473 RepID=A0ABQ0LKQ1_MYCCL|nr:predicted protein [Mycena chlorophos]